jgi:hypothetical protein
MLTVTRFTMVPPNYTCSSSRRVRRVFLLAATLIAPGCQLAFGTYSGSVSQDTGGIGGMATGGTAAGGVATIGGSSSGGDTIGAGGAAGSGGCTADSCPKCSTSDPPYCGTPTDAGTPLMKCENALVGFISSDICKDEWHCATGVDHCIVCEVNETHCDWSPTGILTGNGKSCTSDQRDWSDYPCQNGGCVPDGGTPDRCDICIEGSTQCVDIPTSTVTLHYKRTCLHANWQTEDCPKGCQPPDLKGNPAVCITQTTH